MLSGFYEGASAINYENERLRGINNNLSNSATSAFHKNSMIMRTRKENPFRRRVDSAVRKSTPAFYGTQRHGVYNDFSAPLSRQSTENPMHVALSPNMQNAFFAVRGGTPLQPQTSYTRNGHLTIQLLDANNPSSPQVLHIGGYVALDAQNQPITIDSAAGALSIGRDGSIEQNGNSVGQIPVFRMNKSADPLNQQNANLQLLEKKGDLLFSIPNKAQKEVFAVPIAADQNSQLMRQGEIEGSNVEPLSEMVQMMSTTRNAASNQSLMHIQTEGLSKLFQYARS